MTNGTDARTDQAALMGVTLAAFLTIFLPEGPWGWMGTIVGVTLGLLLVGYYRPIWSRTLLDALSKALALATVGALCFSIAIAFFFQEEWVRPNIKKSCVAEINLQFPTGATELPRPTKEFKRVQVENCLGDETSVRLPWIWLGAGLVIFVAYLVFWAIISQRKEATFDWHWRRLRWRESHEDPGSPELTGNGRSPTSETTI